MLKKKFNAASTPLFEYHIVMNEPVLSDDKNEQRNACRDRSEHFSLLLNGWAVGAGAKRDGRFDAAVPYGPAPKSGAYDLADRPFLKVFCSSATMRKLQRDFGHRLHSITRAAKWHKAGPEVSKFQWKHPRLPNSK